MLLKNKSVSFINIGGLGIGMAVTLLIGLWVWDEVSFNQNHPGYPRIGRVLRNLTYDGVRGPNENLPYPLTTSLKSTYRNNFKYVISATAPKSMDLLAGETAVSKTGQYFDAAAPAMFGLHMLRGTQQALTDPYSIVLSASASKDIFGDMDPINKTIQLSDKTIVRVTGIFEDLPKNSEFHKLQFLLPFSLFEITNPWVIKQSWNNSFLRMYVEIKSGASFQSVDKNIRDAEISITKHLENYKKQAARQPEVFVQPMHEWHLYSDFKESRGDQARARFVWMVGTVGFFVLVLACINFINLSTARSEKRAREVGIRKAIGSGRNQLIQQFFSESFMVVIIAFILAIVLANITLPAFNSLSEKEMKIPFLKAWFWIISSGFILLTGVMAGAYPALYLSSFKPIKVLKGSFFVGRLAALPRKSLVVLQFTISVALIICTVIVYNQLTYAKNRPVGYTRDGLLMLQIRSDELSGKLNVLQNELTHTGMVSYISESGGAVTNVWQGNGGFDWKGKDRSNDIHFGTLGITHDYGKTLKWQLIEGRDFSRQSVTDSSAVIINESAAKIMGLQNPIGEFIRWEPGWMPAKFYKIIGIVKDMVMASPYEPTVPTIFRLERNLSWINLRIDPGVAGNKALPVIESVFKKISPSSVFDYKFADQEYALKFEAEEHIGRLSVFFAVLTILISCLGLFGLSSFLAEQRTKEIGVRKVLGASVAGICRLLSMDFIKLIFISLLIATPLTYYLMDKWLQNYIYRAEISWWIFVAAGVLAILITLLTVGYQSIKAAIANPVKSLRSE